MKLRGFTVGFRISGMRALGFEGLGLMGLGFRVEGLGLRFRVQG